MVLFAGFVKFRVHPRARGHPWHMSSWHRTLHCIAFPFYNPAPCIESTLHAVCCTCSVTPCSCVGPCALLPACLASLTLIFLLSQHLSSLYYLQVPLQDRFTFGSCTCSDACAWLRRLLIDVGFCSSALAAATLSPWPPCAAGCWQVSLLSSCSGLQSPCVGVHAHASQRCLVSGWFGA
jgi:hypothetical protein